MLVLPNLPTPFKTRSTGEEEHLWPNSGSPINWRSIRSPARLRSVFQYLKRLPPFDDEPLRRELMTRLNEIRGIDLAEAKLDLRPSFPLEVFAEHSEEICGVLEWFAHTAALAEARRMVDGNPDTL